MIGVFIAGALGFFVFDLYRIYLVKQKQKRFEITFATLPGILVHIGVYIAAGIAAIALNLDVLVSCCSATNDSFLQKELVGAYLRAFGLGVAGPAGITKWNTGMGPTDNEHGTSSLDDLTGPDAGLLKRLGFYASRLLMR